jgi:methylamine dehydrogenase accessory protein MauD
MASTLVISNILLWLVVLGLGLLVLSLARQVGILHERISPAGALMVANQLETGAPVPTYALEALDGRQVEIGSANTDSRRTLLYFLSPTCPICSSLLGVVRDLADSDSALDVILMSDGPAAEHEKYRARKTRVIGDFPYVLSEDVGRAFGVAKLPYAVLIDAKGLLVAHGLVNTREHLESLFEAEAQGVASIQAFIEGQGEAAGQKAVEMPDDGAKIIAGED